MRRRYESSCNLGNTAAQSSRFSWHIGCETIHQDESDSVALVIAQEGGEGTMKENILMMIGGDASVQQQYLDTVRRSEPLEPEKALLVAILEDAIHTYRKYRTARQRAGKKRFCEAEEWIMGGGNDWIFSFHNVCELLSLNPDYIRRGVIESVNETAKEEKSRSSDETPGQAA
jgi:hypothetical protein